MIRAFISVTIKVKLINIGMNKFKHLKRKVKKIAFLFILQKIKQLNKTIKKRMVKDYEYNY